MPPSDGVSSLDTLNDKYKPWRKDFHTRDGATAGSCNVDSLYDKTEISDGTSTGSRIHDYYVCGATDGGKCVGLSFSEWDDIWGNCNSLPGNVDYDRDKCINMAVQNTPGVNEFDMGLEAGAEDVYDPVTNSGCNGCSLSDRRGADVDNYSALGDTARYNSGMASSVLFSTDGDGLEDNCDDCRISGVEGMRPAFPNNKTDKLTTIGATDGDLDETILCPYGGILSKQLYCSLDGHEAIGDDGMGCGMGGDGGLEDLARFCARGKSYYADEKIAQCCLGSIADGPEVDIDGHPIQAAYKDCPRDYCVTRVAEGTESGAPGVNCDNPTTSKNAANEDETFCYEMSEPCNTFFHDKCQDAFDEDYIGPLKQYCKDWAHIQPQQFITIADRVCNINNGTHDYVDTPPTTDDLNNVKKVLNTPLCRDYITSHEHYPTESNKLNNLCSHYMKLNEDTGDWEAQTGLDHEGILDKICGCHYDPEYYTWYTRTHETREAGTCAGPDGPLTAISRSDCESGSPTGTWTPEAGASSITAAVKDILKPYPQCYYDKCISSMLYDVHNDDIPCNQALMICQNSMTQNNVMVGNDGDITQLPDMSALTGLAQQSCNQGALSAPPPPPADDDDDDSSGIGSTISSWLGGGSGSGSGSGGGNNSTMIIIIILVIIIIIIGVFVVVMLNKGNPNPPQQIAEQIAQQAPAPA